MPLWKMRLLACAFLAGTGICNAEVAYRLEDWATGLDQPWSLALLPDGSALVTEKPGRLRRIGPNGDVGAPIEGVPAVYFSGQAGLFDVVLHPGFTDNQLIYLAYAEGDAGDNGTVVARARLAGSRLDDFEEIHRVTPRKKTSAHFGGRLAFLPDGSLLLTTGDGFDYREAAQDTASELGKLLRMRDDGSPAEGNPIPGAPWVYSFGHRNPQGLAVADDGTIWLHEHGPRGGDEVNRIEPGVNYGWPVITYGLDYSGAVISPFTAREGMAQPQHYWVPSIAPSGLAIYEGAMFPEWQGDLLVGALVDREVRRLDVEGGRIVGEEALFTELDVRIRDVRVGPNGAIYLVTNDEPGRVVRVLSGD